MKENNAENLEVGIKEILELLPHRYPFLLVDKVKDIIPFKSAVGIKNVTINEEFFNGHFPGNPVMPGVLMIEAFAQAGGILVMKSLGDAGKGKSVLFTSVDNVKFRKTVCPGDTLELYVNVIKNKMNIWFLEGYGVVGDRKVIELSVSAMIMDR